MKIEVQSRLLQESLTKNVHISEKLYYMVFKVSAEKQQLSIFSFGKDYNQYIFTTTPVTVIEKGEFAIDGNRMLGLIKIIDGSITMSIVELKNGTKKLKIKHQRKEYKFDLINLSEISFKYPENFIEKFAQSNTIKMSQFFTELGRLLSFAVKSDQFHAWQDMAKIRLNKHSNLVRFDLCETIRFSKNSYTEDNISIDQELLLFSKDIANLIRVFGKIDSEDDKLTVGDNWCCFSNNNTYCFCQLSDLTYPNIDKVWESKVPKHKLIINLTLFTETMKRCVIITKDSKGFTDTPVIIEIDNNIMKVEIQDKLNEEIEIECKTTFENCISSGFSFKDSYSSDQILDCLKNIYKTDKITIGFIDQKSPMIIDDGTGYMVMVQRRK